MARSDSTALPSAQPLHRPEPALALPEAFAAYVRAVQRSAEERAERVRAQKAALAALQRRVTRHMSVGMVAADPLGMGRTTPAASSRPFVVWDFTCRQVVAIGVILSCNSAVQWYAKHAVGSNATGG